MCATAPFFYFLIFTFLLINHYASKGVILQSHSPLFRKSFYYRSHGLQQGGVNHFGIGYFLIRYHRTPVSFLIRLVKNGLAFYFHLQFDGVAVLEEFGGELVILVVEANGKLEFFVHGEWL